MYVPPVVGAVPCTPAEVLRALSYAIRAERSGKFDLPPWVSDEVQRAAKVSSKDQYAQSAIGYARCCCISNRAKSLSTRRPLLFRIRSGLLRTRRSCSHVSTTLFKAWLYKLASLSLGLLPKSTKVSATWHTTCTCVALCASCCHHACALAYTPNACCLR